MNLDVYPEGPKELLRLFYNWWKAVAEGSLNREYAVNFYRQVNKLLRKPVFLLLLFSSS